MADTAEVQDGTPRRDFVEYDHPDGLYTLEVHQVTADTEGEVTVPGGTVQSVRAGDYLVRRGGSVYDVHNADAFEEMGLVAAREQKNLEQWESTVDEPAPFDPSEHTAAEVRRYLRDPNLSDEERQRVEDAERDGKNRESAFPTR